MSNDITLVPNYLDARDPKGLRALCIQNNVSKNKAFKYEITFANGKWVAWYYEDCSDELLNQQVSDAQSKGDNVSE